MMHMNKKSIREKWVTRTEDIVTRGVVDHLDVEHGDMPRVVGESVLSVYQCMAGADEGEVGCSTVIPEGNNGTP